MSEGAQLVDGQYKWPKEGRAEADFGHGSPIRHYSAALDNATLPGTLKAEPSEARSALPEDDAARLNFPMFDGLIAYFPNALAEVSRVSKLGNDQHNPGEPMHWARGKSTDHENKIVRHLLDSGGKDERGVRHSARLAWRALALLQQELEREEGAPMARGARLPS